MSSRARVITLLMASLLSACAKKRPAAPRTSTPGGAPARTTTARASKSPVMTPRSSEATIPEPGKSEMGMASWYGLPFHGRAAANGEIYDMEKLTAAHRTLPFGTWVRVTNLANNKTVDVRITDRGPFIAGRIIDLSHAAAQDIELIGPGVSQVRIDIISGPQLQIAGSLYSVQAGIFTDRTRAEHLRESLENKFGAARLIYKDARPPAWRLLVGVEETVEGASLLARKIKLEAGSGFVVRLDEIAPGPVPLK